MRTGDAPSPRYIHHFTMSYEQWRAFYDRKTCKVRRGWGNQLVQHLYQLKITCTIIFRYQHTSKENTRKKNSNLFSGNDYCKHKMCPVTVIIEVQNAPRNKHSATLFKVVVNGDARHDPKVETVARPLTGAAREVIGMSLFSLDKVSFSFLF